MKKISMLILTALMAVVLSACSETANPVDSEPASAESKNNNETEEKAEMKSELTLQEVFEKSMEANQEIKSFATDLDLNQVMEIQGEKMAMSSKMHMKFITEPITLHQKMTYNIELGAEGTQSFDTEAYLTEDGFYMYEPMENMWLKMPQELSDQILQMQNAQSNPAEQLEQLKAFVDDFKFEQNDTHYILTLKAAGDKFNQFLKETMKESLPEDMLLDDEVFNSMKFNGVEYEIFVDKETFYTTDLNMLLDTETKMDGEVMKLKQDIKAAYSDYNKIDKIKVPQEALESAQEINLSDLEGAE